MHSSSSSPISYSPKCFTTTFERLFLFLYLPFKNLKRTRENMSSFWGSKGDQDTFSNLYSVCRILDVPNSFQVLNCHGPFESCLWSCWQNHSLKLQRNFLNCFSYSHLNIPVVTSMIFCIYKPISKLKYSCIKLPDFHVKFHPQSLFIEPFCPTERNYGMLFNQLVSTKI